MKTVAFEIIDSIGVVHKLLIPVGKFRSLMDFIRDDLVEDIGDCLGRAWCGTCLISLVQGEFNYPIEAAERHLIEVKKKKKKTTLQIM